VKKLTLSDIIKKTSVNNNVVQYCFMEYHPTVGTFPMEISPTYAKTVELNQKYPSDPFSQQCVDEVILEQHIRKLLLKEYSDEMNDMRIIYFQDFNNPCDEESKKFRLQVQMLSNNIVCKGRIGREATLIIDPNYVKYFKNDEELWSRYNFFTHKGLNNKIILVHISVKNLYETNNFMLFHTNERYAIEEIGDFDNLYHVLDIKCLKKDRTKKLQRILK